MVIVQPPLLDLPEPRVLVTCPRCRNLIEVADPPPLASACPRCDEPHLLRDAA